MFRLALPVALCLGTPSLAQTTCPMTGDQSNCSRILACIGSDRWFEGRGIGRGNGTLAGTMSDGTTCTGTWTARNWFGAGQADVICDDGMSVTVLYTYQDEWTGTAVGGGEANTGDWVQAWSGNNVLDYLEAETGRIKSLPCSFGDIPVS